MAGDDPEPAYVVQLHDRGRRAAGRGPAGYAGPPQTAGACPGLLLMTSVRPPALTGARRCPG